MINIKELGLTEAQALTALYNASKPQGMGFLHFTPKGMTEEEASVLLQPPANKCFDYLQGRVIKVRIVEQIEECLYDRDNGTGAAYKALTEYAKKIKVEEVTQ